MLEYSGFSDEMVKLAKERKRTVMTGVAKARPWVGDALKGAITGGLSANFLLPIKDATRKGRYVAAAGALGASTGIGNRAIKNWANRNKRTKGNVTLAREILKESALAGDLRRNGLGNVKRPPFPTERSKSVATSSLVNSQNVANMTPANTSIPKY